MRFQENNQPASSLLQHYHQLSIPALAESKELNHSITRIAKRWPDITIQAQLKEREALLKKLMQCLTQWQWHGIKMHLICRGARYVFDEDFLPLTNYDPLRDFYIKEIIATPSSVFITTLFKTYLESYSPNKRHTTLLAHALSQRIPLIGGKSKQIIEKIPEILDPNIAPNAVIAPLLRVPQPYLHLKNMGLTSSRGSGIMLHIHHAYIQKISPSLHERAAIDALLNWLKPKGHESVNTGAEDALAAILSPWKQMQPDDDLKDYLLENLLELYGDPRTNNGDVWGRVPEDARNVILRWLTKDDILFFMDIVSDSEGSHMWEYRRKFWLGLYEKGYISAAWVAFSKEGYERAHHVKKHNPSMKGRQFASAQGRSHTSLLIMQIGRLIVVEGSHSYKVQFYNAHLDRDAPKLFKLNYDCEEIRLQSRESIAHNSGWQQKVTEYIGFHA